MTHYRFSDLPASAAADQSPRSSEWSVRQTRPGCFIGVSGERTERLYAAARGDAIYVQLRGRVWRVHRVDPTVAADSGAPGAPGSACAPMPGVVVTVLVDEGSAVSQGDPLIVLESMKMQITISAPLDGRVRSLPYGPGQTVDRGAVLAHLEPADSVRSPGDAL